MPYLEIIAPASNAAARDAFVRAGTEAIAAQFGVSALTVTVYFVPVPQDGYAHAGAMLRFEGPDARVLIKVHAYRRDIDERRRAAAALTDAYQASFGTRRDRIAVYFIDRMRDEVAHAGRLSCDLQ